MAKTTTHPELVEKLGIPHERGRSWVNKGIIHASVHHSHSRGKPSIHTLEDCYHARAVQHLVMLGLNPTDASELADKPDWSNVGSAQAFAIVARGDFEHDHVERSYIFLSGDDDFDIADWPLALILNLTQITNEVDTIFADED